MKDSPARTLVANVLAGAGAQGITALAALWAIPQVLGIVGSAGYGIYSLAGALVGYFSIADLGLGNATLQRLGRARAANDPIAFNETAATSAALLAGVGLMLSMALLAFATPLGHLLAGSNSSAEQATLMVTATRLCAVGALPAMVRPVLEAIFAASERLVITYSISTVTNLTRTIGTVIALWLYPNILTPIIVLVVATLLQFSILLVASIVTTTPFKLTRVRISAKELRLLLGISIPVWLTTGTTLVANQLDKMIVSAVCGLEAAGRYAVAFELASRVWMFPYIFGKAYFARLSNGLATKEPIACQQDIRGYAASSLTSAVVPAVAIGVYASPLLRAYTGQLTVVESPTVLVLLLTGVVCNVASFVAFSVLQLKLHLKALAVPHLVFLIVHSIACVVLTRSLGPTGAAFSWAIAMLLLWLTLQVMLASRYRLGVFGDLLRILVAGAAVAAAFYLLDSTGRTITFSAGSSLFHRLLPILPRSFAAALATLIAAGLTFFARRQYLTRRHQVGD